ncbi:MAG: hypothetical protein MOB07_10285 [Acidobacteria bacterium]|nr:hypothetical protein [Acidobacteriota bacterium]
MEDQNTVKGRIRTGEAEEVEVPVRLQVSEFVPSVVAQHITLQSTTGSVIIAFYEANPPVMLNPTPDSLERFQKEGFTAECVARISVSPSVFLSFADVFTKVAEQTRAKEKENEERSQDAIPQNDQT